MSAEFDNVVYLSAGPPREGDAAERVASGAGDDTIGVSGNVLAFGRPLGMRFLDGADTGAVMAGAGAALPGGLGSVTLFGGLGGEALHTTPIAAGGPGTAQDGFAFAAAAFPDVIGALQPGVQAAAGPNLFAPGAPEISAASTLHLPDGTTVMMLDLSKLTGSALL